MSVTLTLTQVNVLYTKRLSLKTFSYNNFILFFSPSILIAMWTGNPAEPALSTEGIFFSSTKWCSVRMAVAEDFIYAQRYRDDSVDVIADNSSKTFAKLLTSAGIFTFNFINRFDIYGILGTSRLQLNQDVFCHQEFSWGAGGKIVIFKTDHFFIGADMKYFATDQSPLFLVCDGLPYNTVSDFKLNYSEVQASAGLCCCTKPIAPYIQITYMFSRIDPHPLKVLVQWPLQNQVVTDIDCKPSIIQRCWGITLGATILSAKKLTFSIESRMLNQNAINACLEIRL